MPDRMITNDDWSDLSRQRPMPEIDRNRLHRYRTKRLKEALVRHDAAMCLLVNPISLRYAVDFRSYPLFQSHIPLAYLFFPQEGPSVVHGVFGPLPTAADSVRPARPLSYFEGADTLAETARLLADDIVQFLSEIGTTNRRVAVEYVNPSLTQALLQRGIEVIDGVLVSEEARVIKSEDEIACIRWAVLVAELGMAKMKEALRAGVSEVQLWALLNYTNLANDGDWHEGRMLASGPRVNPWGQEATPRIIESGDLVGFDTDMVGPMGYFADISRTFHCGPTPPSARQKQLYRLALAEIEHNLRLVRPGVSLSDFQERAWPVPEEFQKNAYSCVIHGVGMCDEYPQVRPVFRGPAAYEGILREGMVICVESYMGAVGERDGVKLEQQVLVTKEGCEIMSTFPMEAALV
ncbi:MAG: M24 family metallopeptidase [Pirellulales bacterium]